MREGRLPLTYKLLDALYNRALVARDFSFVDLCELLAMANVSHQERLISPYEYQHLMDVYGKIRRESGLSKVDPQPTSSFARYLGNIFHRVYTSRIEDVQSWQDLAEGIDYNRRFFGPGEYDILVALINTHSVEIENAVYKQRGAGDCMELNRIARNYVSYDTLKAAITDSCRFQQCLVQEEYDYLLCMLQLSLDGNYITVPQFSELKSRMDRFISEKRRKPFSSTVSRMDLF